MRLICILFIVLFSSSVNAQIREARLKTLLSICETAQSNNDLGTIKKYCTSDQRCAVTNRSNIGIKNENLSFGSEWYLKQSKLMLKV